MPGRSQKAARYGSLAESHVIDRYNLEPEHDRYHDAVDPSNGKPWEIKAAMRELASGESGRFRLFESQHDQLEEERGRYAFVAYRPRGRGIQVLETRVIDARSMSLEYGPSEHGSPNRDRQTKIPVGEVF
jgi:hypothetical protein